MYALSFALIGGLCLWSALQPGHGPIAQVALYWAALAALGLSVAYLANAPRMLGKRQDGRLAWWSWLLYLPYHALNAMLMLLIHWFGRENPADEVAPGIWLGRRLLPQSRHAVPRDVAVLDACAELPELRSLRPPHVRAYLSLPILDTLGPSQEQLKRAAAFLKHHSSEGPVFVHCAAGHGRSASLLLSAGASDTASVESHERELQSKRPGIRLTPGQRRALIRLWDPGNQEAAKEEL